MKLITSLKYGKYSNGPRVCIPEHPCLEDFFKFVNSTFDPNQAHDFDSLYLRLSLIVAAQRGSSFFLKQKEKIQYSLHRTLLPREIINKIMDVKVPSAYISKQLLFNRALSSLSKYFSA